MRATGENPAPDDPLRAEAAAWLARLRGPSTPEDHAAFEAWYNAAPEHGEAYDAVLRSWEAAGLAQFTPTGQARSRLRAGHVYRWRYAIAAAAATVVIVLLAFGAYGAPSAPDRLQAAEFATKASEIRTIELADGSHVTLDTASVLRTAYSAESRRVTLVRGRARFAVAHDKGRPFIVATPFGSILAHGTVFDVAFDGARLTVSLLEGSVEVRQAKAPGKPAVSRLLAPGQSVIASGDQIRLPARSPPADTDWPTGMMSVEDAPVGAVVAAAVRHGSSGIVLADPALARLRFTGTFKAADSEQLARLIAATFRLEMSRRDDGALMLSPPRASARAAGKKVPG